MNIPIRDIAVVKRQRKKMDPTKLQRLANNIKTAGRLIHPINVRPTRTDDMYPQGHPKAGQHVEQPWVLITGGRRIAAHIILKKDDIEARNFDDLPPLEQKVIELYENLDREDLPYADELEAKAEILRIRVAEGKTQAEVAEELGEDPGNFARDIQLHSEIKQDPTIKEAGTKNAARKLVEHRKEIDRRVQTIKQVDVSGLKARLFTAKAEDFVRTLADNSVDLHMWDPPWAINYKSPTEIAKATSGSIVKGKYDDSPEANLDMLVDVIPHVVRTVKPNGWICIIFATTGMNWLRTHLMSACKIHQGYCDVKYDFETGEFERASTVCSNVKVGDFCEFLNPEILPCIWYRPNSRNIGQWPDRHFKHVYESIMVVPGSSKARLVLTGKPDVLVYDAIYEDRLHEMQKPHELIKDLISRFTVMGELVVDLTFGSGAHLAAAAELNRDFKGCERNPELLSTALGLVAQFYNKGAAAAVIAGKQGTARTAAELAGGNSKAHHARAAVGSGSKAASPPPPGDRASIIKELDDLGIAFTDDEANSIPG
jgi:DNA modification methylase/ParB-like chromosome segregation protein Spo0J